MNEIMTVNEGSIIQEIIGDGTVTETEFNSFSPHYKKRIQKIEISIRRYLVSMKCRIYDIGKLLFEAKKILPHGQFQPWIEQTFGGELPYSTAAAFKDVYDHFKDCPKMVRYIPVSLLLLIKQKGFSEEILKRIEDDPEGFAKVVVAAGLERVKRACKELQQGEITVEDFWADLQTPIKFDNGKFSFKLLSKFTLEEQLRDIRNTQAILCRGFSDIDRSVVSITNYANNLGHDTLDRDQWLPPFREYVNREIDDKILKIRKLEEAKHIINKYFSDFKPLTVRGLPDPEPLQITHAAGVI